MYRLFKFVDPQGQKHRLGLALDAPFVDLVFVLRKGCLKNSHSLLKLRLLGKITQDQVVSQGHFAAVRLLQTGDDLEQGTFSRSVDADDADLFALVDGEIRLAKDLSLGKYFGKIFYRE